MNNADIKILELLALRDTVEIEDNWQALRALETLPLVQDARLLHSV